ncbi:hypothetical protein [Kribbella sp.]|uniref:hypothetical protein n=1 Tax=Kribbella sp. TaxID=1871183 RepID=UPI002D356132|nr:hypothetical protein [Kribbella sp.]HZX03256.1 hypothetical protein [Kribbella sp.]
MIEWPPGARSIRFELRDRLHHPEFSWPRTLLTYRVRWSEPLYGQLHLSDATGSPVPFQLSNIHRENGLLTEADVSFVADLPPGAARTFELGLGGRSTVAGNSVVISYEADSIVVDTGSLRVRLPRSLNSPGIQFDHGTGWLGRTTFHNTPPLVGLQTILRESGDLFATFRLTYEFEGSATYVATIRCIAGYEYIELDEEMCGLGDAAWELEWTGFHPTHRFSSTWPYSQNPADYQPQPGVSRWLPIDEPLVIGDTGEDPAFFGPGRIEDPAAEFAFTVAPYAPSYAFDVRPHATFWNDRTSVGVFVLRPERWDDHQYALWASSPALRIRFRYADGVLRWTWPLRDGTRRTGIACYDHARDLDVPQEFRTTHVRQLQHWHSTLSLDLVKDWQLRYDGTRPDSPFHEGVLTSADELVDELFHGADGPRLIARGVNDVGGYSNIGQRPLYERFVDGYARLRGELDPAERERVEALLLLNAYVAAGEEIGPMLRMFGGHPNFMADGKAALGCFAWLFPEHPAAASWLDQFGKFVELVAAFHTRPADGDARGGRWTESLATYVWAFLRPTVLGNISGMLADGRNRLADPQLAAMGTWLVESLSSPMVFGGRVHPPQGAHAYWPRRPPLELRLLAQALRNYAPMVAEHLLWASSPDASLLEHRPGAPDPWRSAVAPDRGTNPRLRSTKHAGYGVTLRADVDRPSEIAVFLQQTDPGPNYRWGVPGDNGSGTIYYYAGGRSYSGHGPEDAGDRRAPAATYTSSFGVWADGSYRSIGPNTLDRPLYDLGWAQYAEITSAGGPYRSRSVMLLGSDYITTYDAVAPNQRTAWTWSVATVATGWDANSIDQVVDELPFIHVVGRELSEFTTEFSRGVRSESPADGTGGNVLAVVSHRRDLHVTDTPWGALVRTPETVDYVFRRTASVYYEPQQIEHVYFTGTAGAVRLHTDGTQQLALFQGSRIGTPAITLTTPDPALAITLDFPSLKGTYYSPTPTTFTLTPTTGDLYVDGERATFTAVPAGRHHWEVTTGKPQPLPPEITHTTGTTVHFTPVPAAETYELELSHDGGLTWTTSAYEADGACFDLNRLERDVHVRVVAVNSDQRSDPGRDYPVRVVDGPPLPPDGLRVNADRRLTWGQVLGVSAYRLYRRVDREGEYEEIYRGPAVEFVDTVDGLHEYAVAAENPYGVGARSAPVDTSRRNWHPPGGASYRRTHTYNQSPYRT